jgi:hypothetical protein
VRVVEERALYPHETAEFAYCEAESLWLRGPRFPWSI